MENSDNVGEGVYKILDNQAFEWASPLSKSY